MSIRRHGSGWSVRWTEGGRKRSRSFTRKHDAEVFEVDVKRRRQLGGLAAGVVESKQTVGEFVEDEWWPRYALLDLAEDTQRRYLEIWGEDLEPRIGAYPLREVTPLVVEDLRDALRRKGLAPATQRKTLHLLSSILRRAVVRGLIPANPVDSVSKPKTPPPSTPSPLTPETVERIRAHMLAPKKRRVPAAAPGKRPRRAFEAAVGDPLTRQRDALIVSLIAYAGLRPAEDRAATWGDVRGKTLRVFASKTRRERFVDLLAPLAGDLAAYRLACGRPGDAALIIPRADGSEWTRDDWKNWRNRVYGPAARAAGVTGDMRPYRLRGSFVSLLLWSGEDLVYVADQAGHSVATLARHYAGVIRELREVERRPAADLIREAREIVADPERTQARRRSAQGA